MLYKYKYNLHHQKSLNRYFLNLFLNVLIFIITMRSHVEQTICNSGVGNKEIDGINNYFRGSVCKCITAGIQKIIVKYCYFRDCRVQYTRYTIIDMQN